MYEEEVYFEALLFKHLEMVLEHLTLVTLTFNPVTPKSNVTMSNVFSFQLLFINHCILSL